MTVVKMGDNKVRKRIGKGSSQICMAGRNRNMHGQLGD